MNMFTRIHDVNNISTWKDCMCSHINNELIHLDLICFPLLCTPSRVSNVLKQLNMLCHQMRVYSISDHQGVLLPKTPSQVRYIYQHDNQVRLVYLSSSHMVGCTGRSNTAALTSGVVMAGI